MVPVGGSVPGASGDAYTIPEDDHRVGRAVGGRLQDVSKRAGGDPVSQYLSQTFVVDLEDLGRPADTALGTDAFLTVDPYLKSHVQNPFLEARRLPVDDDVQPFGTILQKVRHQLVLVVGR